MYRDRVNVEYEMYDYGSNNWNHRQSNKSCKETFGSQARITLNRFTTKDGCTYYFTHNTESTAV